MRTPAKIETLRTLGPKGGLTKWTAAINGEPLALIMHSEQKFDTKRAAHRAALGYVQRHPEQFTNI
jgi:hypothetical protein